MHIKTFFMYTEAFTNIIVPEVQSRTNELKEVWKNVSGIYV